MAFEYDPEKSASNKAKHNFITQPRTESIASWMIRNRVTAYDAKSSLESLDKYQATVEAAAEAILSVRGCVMKFCLPK